MQKYALKIISLIILDKILMRLNEVIKDLASSKIYLDFLVKSENLKNLIYLHLKNFK